MATPKSSLLIFFFSSFLLFFSSLTTAHNITRILENYPEFSGFSELLNRTHLTSQINSRSTITVLAVKDVSAISSKPLDIAKSIMATHVILDYYDAFKLQRENKKSIILTTLFQSSGIAGGQQGFLNITKSNGEIRFGSAVRGASHDSKLVRLVVAHPYNISVLEVSSLIFAPGIDGNLTSSPPPKAPAPQSKKAPPPATESEAESPEAETAEAPEEDTSEAPAPSEDAPASSPPVAADEPAADEEKEAAPAPTKSSGSRVAFGACGALVMGLVSGLMAF